ncbi:hypothetical protein OG519_00555 [Streptomyces sp. NBC_01190]|nr:hypothetical protein OG519_00555 [Streptomyces sp. NBC_01190]
MNYADFLLPTIVLLGVGFALCFPSVNVQATTGISDHEQGLASGLLNSGLQIGGAIMLAVVTSILGSGTTTTAHHQLFPHMKAAVTVTVCVTAVALLLTGTYHYRDRSAVTAAGDRPLPAGA